MANTSMNTNMLIRSDVWGTDLLASLTGELFAVQFSEELTEFPDGSSFHIPTLGDATVYDYEENTPAQFRPISTGELLFEITDYIASDTYITDKLAEDSAWLARNDGLFVPKQTEALLARFETRLWGASQTGAGVNGRRLINGYAHRFAASGVGSMLTMNDFVMARAILDLAKVPAAGRVAVISPQAEASLLTAQLSNVAYIPKWGNVIPDGFSTGTRFAVSVLGFDVYVSNYLPTVTDAALPVADNSRTVSFATVPGVVNLFFSTNPISRPFLHGWRQMVKVEYHRNAPERRHEYLVSSRFGVMVQRQEALVTIVSSSALVPVPPLPEDPEA